MFVRWGCPCDRRCLVACGMRRVDCLGLLTEFASVFGFMPDRAGRAVSCRAHAQHADAQRRRMPLSGKSLRACGALRCPAEPEIFCRFTAIFGFKSSVNGHLLLLKNSIARSLRFSRAEQPATAPRPGRTQSGHGANSSPKNNAF